MKKSISYKNLVCCALSLAVIALSACSVVSASEPFSIQIERTHGTLQGHHEYIDIYLSKGTAEIGGFDFLIKYYHGLTYFGATEGSIYDKFGWEYFSSRFGDNGNCSGRCPPGLIRVTGIAKINNDNSNPSNCLMEAGDTFATLDFLVSDDRTLECQFLPIRFYWQDCGDNSIVDRIGDTLFISRSVFDFDLIGEITDPSTGYPTYQGAQDEDCSRGNPHRTPIRFVDFINGGVDIVCADILDLTGDLNLNEIAFEIADAVLYRDYFVDGLEVFDVNLEGQIAASDVNRDGLTLTLSDFIFLTRVVTGDAIPNQSGNVTTSEHTARFSQNIIRHTISVETPDVMRAIKLVFDDSIAPHLEADYMEMKYRYDSLLNQTWVLIYSFEGSYIYEGLVLSYHGEGNLIEAETAGYTGVLMINSEIDFVTSVPNDSHSNLPHVYALHQNYPNPFNPTTTINFQLAQAGKYKIEIFNVSGRKVKSFEGSASPGTVEIEWDATGMSSGLYYYRLTAGDFVETKKMLLLK